MIAPDLETATARLRDLIEASERVVPVYRRRHLDRMRHSGFPFARRLVDQERSRSRSIEFLASQEMRDEAWRRRFAMEEYFAKAQADARTSRARAALSQPANRRA